MQTEQELIRRTREGDGKAALQFIQRYEGRVMQLVRRMVTRREEATPTPR